MLFKDFFPIDQLIQETINKLDKIKKTEQLAIRDDWINFRDDLIDLPLVLK